MTFSEILRIAECDEESCNQPRVSKQQNSRFAGCFSFPLLGPVFDTDQIMC
jgi:hypothetical protein